jgi:hypothetical protein
MIRETTDYFKVLKQKDTIRVNGISLKKSAKILLEVDNYNPYYWNARVTAFKKPLEEEVSYAGVFNPFSVLGQSLGLSAMLPNLDMPKISQRGAGASDKKEDIFLSLNAAFQYNYKKLQESLQKAAELNYLEMLLTHLKYDIKKTGYEIKDQAHKAVIKVLGNDTLDFDHSISIGRQFDMQLNTASDSLNILAAQIEKTGADISSLSFYGLAVKDYIGQTKSALDKSRNLSSATGMTGQLFTQKVAAISKLYNEITGTPFKYSYILNGEPDITELKLEIYPRLDSLSKDTVVKYFPVKSRSNVKIRNSVGITFTYYKDNNRSYFIKPDSTIGEGKGDLFTPVLSTFIHFYGANQSGIKWGGAIGFGIPLQGDKKDINFLLGLSAVLGRNEPVIISAGLSGGKVNTLGGGYQKGDKMPSTTFQLPSKTGYKAGAFLSITFNLSNLNLGAKK